MIVLSGQGLTQYAAGRVLFRGLSIAVEDKDRAALVGVNGSGKSTLLRILARIDHAEDGDVTSKRDSRISLVHQHDVFEDSSSVEDVIRQSVRTARLPSVSHEAVIATTLGVCGFTDNSRKVCELSGGWKKRLAIANALASQPDILLLDEPTNHLDIEGILWLEQLLTRFPGAVIYVSHDRYFIERTASKVMELDARYQGFLFESEGSYSTFLEKRAGFLSSLGEYYASLANKVRREVEWLRQGAKARSTKAKGRIKQAERLIQELKSAPRSSGAVNIEFTGTGKKSKEILKAEKIGKSYGEKRLFRDLSFSLAPGARLGVVGPNGCGKTTLQKVLTGQIAPDEGKVWRSPNAKWLVFDQNRELLDRSQTLKEALCPHGDSVIFSGNEVHVSSWARRFLFSPSQMSLPVGSLSGGEQARVMIARLMLQPVDCLFLDEPTNDLDIPTLEVLEESLLDFSGVVVLTTHDRYLLDRLATSLIGLHNNGESHMYADYSQFEAAHRKITERKRSPGDEPVARRSVQSGRPGRLSYMEQREYDSIEARLFEAEERLSQLRTEIETDDAVSNPERLKETWENLSKQEALVEELYNRWNDLEKKREQ